MAIHQPRTILEMLYSNNFVPIITKPTSLKYTAALIWETIPKQLKSLNNFAFKRNCKTFLLQNQ